MKITHRFSLNSRGRAEIKVKPHRKFLVAYLFSALVLLNLTLSTPAVSSELPKVRWQAPVAEKVEVLREFEKPAQKWSAGHRGVDLANSGGQVLSPAPGKVVFAGKVVDRTVITVEHADGLRSSFEPVTDPLPVGTEVSAGDVIARVDPAVEHCPVQCVHWGVRSGSGDSEEYLNPLLFLGLEGPSVLLPIGDDFAA